MLSRLSSRVVAAATAAVLVGGSTLLIAGSASADPLPVVGLGDASTVGAAAQVDVTLGDFLVYKQQSAFGVLDVEVGQKDASQNTNVTLLDAGVPGLASLTAASVSSAVLASPDVSEAASSVSGTSLDFLGLSVVGLANASAATRCFVGQDGQATLDTSGLTVFDIPVDLDALPQGYAASQPLGSAVQVGADPTDVQDLSGIDLEIQIGQLRETSEDGAASIALAAQLSIEGTLFEGTANEEAVPAKVVANLVLAGASCLTPVPLSLSAISPATGSTAGGETVTLTGAGFTTGTTVTFDGVPATIVAIDPTGTSLTVTTPAHVAGDVTVTATSSAAVSASLQYTYVAPVVPVKPADPASATGSGTSKLAATGADPVPALGLGAGVLALGLGALLATAAVRRRRA
ncbi:IPT/TIG domain-containing protein [Cnuibacter sp. UC19_7]|uniref:IPT/TIG domain-containing protein n=1 Tax=Cnuibacter sp. UC19_7 TaxID=3350166 RepID=UPI00366B3EE5